MKKTYIVYQTKNFEKGGDFLSHLISECETKEEAMNIAKKYIKEKFCEITIFERETFANGSKRNMIIWRGIRA